MPADFACFEELQFDARSSLDHLLCADEPKVDPSYWPGASALLSSLLPHDAFGVALHRLPRAHRGISQCRQTGLKFVGRNYLWL